MATNQIQLKTLVDLALNCNEPGAVNFNYLRTLLLAILKLTNTDESFIEAKYVETDPVSEENESVVKNDGLATTDEVVNHADKSMRNNKSHEERISNLEKELYQIYSYPSNAELLNPASKDTAEEEQAPDQQILTADRLASVWQGKKITKRLEATEEGIDKLFSLMKDVLSHIEKSQGDREASDEMKENITNLKNNFGRYQEMVDDNKDNIQKLLDQVKQMSEDILSNKNSADKNTLSIDDLRKEIDKLNKQFEKLQSSSSMEKIDQPSSLSDEVKKQSKIMAGKADKSSVKDLQEHVNRLQKVMNEMADKLKVNGLADNHQEANVLSFNELTEKVDKMEKEITAKANQDDVEEICKNMAINKEKIQNLDDEIGKIKQSLSNMDNSEMKRLIENMDRLKKMSDEIDELRKLSHLKDLADNVEDLKSIKKSVDDLLKDMQQGKIDSNEMKNNVNDISEKLRSHEDDKHRLQNNVQSIENSLTDIFNDISKNKQDLSELEALVNNNLRSRMIGDGDHNSKQDSNNADNLISQYENRLAHLESLLDDLKTKQSSMLTKESTEPQTPVFDTSVLAAIQHLAQQNRQQIAALYADLNILRKLQTPASSSSTDSNMAPAAVDNKFVENLQSHLNTLQEEQVKLSGHLSNTIDDTKDEFNRKQQHIDALYDYIDKLQHSKADKDDINSEMDVKADKHALDGKVNMSTFDERYQMLEQTLQDALNRLDQYVNQEADLKEALDKLNEDLNSKMDSDAEKKLKKFMESRLKEIQNSRTNLPDQSNMDFDLRNAAGLRKPMPLSYHCISCDRPVDVTMRGVLPPVPHNFPSKRSMGPHTTFELDQMRQSKRAQTQPVYDKVNTLNRACGGQHTSVNASTYRGQKLFNDINEAMEKMSENSEDVSIIDCVMGKDGQIYRGRFKQNNLPPPIPKKMPPYVGRNKHHKHRVTHSATVVNQKAPSTPPKDDNRPRSAEALEKNATSNGVVLPPISRDSSLVGDEIIMNMET